MTVETQGARRAPAVVPALAEIVLSVGGYYLLRAIGVDVFWALTAPAIAVGVIAVAVTVRRGRVDLFGALVLVELAVTITLTLVTQNPQIAAVREVVYVLVGGLFCLGTLLRRRPLTHVGAASVASFGDPKREWAFEHAWTAVPEYRTGQRLLTASIGLIMTVTALVRVWILLSVSTTDEAGIASAVDWSNVVGLVMVGLLVVAGVTLVRRPRRIVTDLAEGR